MLRCVTGSTLARAYGTIGIVRSGKGAAVAHECTLASAAQQSTDRFGDPVALPIGEGAFAWLHQNQSLAPQAELEAKEVVTRLW